MKEVSLKIKPRKLSDSPEIEVPKDRYPSFSIYSDVPKEVMKLAMGTEMVAKIKVSAKENHEGSNTSESIGFDVLSVVIKDESKIEKAMDDTGVPKDNRESVKKKFKGKNYGST